MKSALEKRYAGLDGRDDHMFVGFKSAVAVRFEVRACVILDFAIWMLMVDYHVVEGLREMDTPGKIYRFLIHLSLVLHPRFFPLRCRSREADGDND